MYKYTDVKGNKPLINVSINELILECSTNEERLTSWLQKESINYERRRHNITTYNIFNERFTDSLTIWSGENNAVTKITFNFEELVIKLQKLLNVNPLLDVSSTELTHVLLERIQKLKSINRKSLLEEEFPLLNEMHSEAINLPQDSYYYSCGLRNALSYFTGGQAEVLTNYVIGLNKIEEYCNSFNLIDFIKANVDIDKLQLFLVNNMFEDMLNNKDEEQNQRYNEIFNRYIRNDKDKSNVYTIDSDGMKRTYLEFTIRYSSYKDRGATLLDWEILRPGSKEYTKTLEKTIRDKAIDEDLIKYIALNDAKKEFYSKLPIVGIAKGLVLNRGYKAFFLPNKEILLDKVSDKEDVVKSYYGNSIYNLNIYNFERISKLTKFVIRKNHLCPFWYHDGTWQKDITQEVVNKPYDNKTYNETEEYVRKLTK